MKTQGLKVLCEKRHWSSLVHLEIFFEEKGEMISFRAFYRREK